MIKVGAATEVEMKEKKVRVEDAGEESSVILNAVSNEKGNYGYNAGTGECGDERLLVSWFYERCAVVWPTFQSFQCFG